jgi:hypothetical protein
MDEETALMLALKALNPKELAIWPQLSMALQDSSMAQQQPATPPMAIGSYATMAVVTTVVHHH